MNFAHLRDFETDELYRAVKHLEPLQADDGWKLLKVILAGQQARQTDVLLLPPSRGETAASYALRQARASGVVDGLRFALDAPVEVLKVARDELEKRQRAAEQAAREGDE